jgi:hypothetical protein
VWYVQINHEQISVYMSQGWHNRYCGRYEALRS